MTKVDIRRLDSVTTNDTTATQLINENFEALQEAIENTISRDGTTPNFMDADLDLNSYKIINAGTPTNNTDVITKEYFDQNVGDASASAAAAAASAQQAATSAQSASGFATVATGAANIAQAARDFIESDPGFQAVSTDLLDENSNIKQVADDLTNIDTVAGIASNVTAVAGIDSDVTTVAGISSDVTAVASNNTDISTVANDITNVNAVADDLTNIDAVNANKTNIDTVAGIDSNVTTVAGIASDVSAVADNNSDISTVADDLTNIDTVSANIANVNAVADISSDVTTVAGISSDVSAVEDIASDVTTVSGIASDVSAVANNNADISTVADDLTNIDTVAADINSVVAVAADLTNIDNASSYAAEAKQWAIGDPTEPSAGSAKYWAGQAAAGQVQANWIEADTTSKAFILNKPTAGDNISLANNQIAAVSDVNPTQYSVNLVQSGGVFTVTNNLQQQIDAIVASSDVFDIVADYTALQAYDITTVPVNDIIKVLVDSTHSGAATYYRCVESGGVKSWSYIGAEGAYYTKGEADVLLSAKADKATTLSGYGITDAYSKTETDTLLSAKQNSLVSGTNIKTLNYLSLLGSGNIAVNDLIPVDDNTPVKASSTDWLYGVYIDEKETNPYTRVGYPVGSDNVGFAPAGMDFDTDTFQYGSWVDAPFLPKPCVLSQSGTVYKYLNPNDYTLFEDGTSASSYINGNTTYNVMVEWEPIYTKYYKSGTRLYFWFSNTKLDGFECWSAKASDGTYHNFYTAAYEGTNSNNTLRSWSTGSKPTASLTGPNEFSYARNNGDSWCTSLYSDWVLIQGLFTLMFKSTNIQTALGYGATGSSSALTVNCGSCNTKGLFYGTSGASSYGIKAFGMEQPYAHRWNRLNGLHLQGGQYMIKMTKHTGDGSSTSDYTPASSSGYIATGVMAPSASESYISTIRVGTKGSLLPTVVSGSNSTYYCDAMWSNLSDLRQALVGGHVHDSLVDGCWALTVNGAPSDSYWGYGASLSCKPF